MDILSGSAEAFWNFLRDLRPELSMLLIRVALIETGLLVGGFLLRNAQPRPGFHTQVFQALIFLGWLVLSFTIPLGEISYQGSNARAMLVLCSILAWIAFPIFVPQVLLRTRGRQIRASLFIYIFEFIVLLIQILVLLGRF